jgi:hypothetical protein
MIVIETNKNNLCFKKTMGKDKEESKKVLLDLLIGMLEAAKKNNKDSAVEIHQKNFMPLFKDVFEKKDENGKKILKLTKESEPYDKARDAIMNSFTDFTKKQKEKLLKAAEGYIKTIIASLQKR